ncbi:glycosyltransferase [Microbacterium sp. W1N]|nr:glycosyltransferase [Microbacterium festucae]
MVGTSRRYIYVGRLVQSKKVDLLVRALAEPRLRAVGMELDLVGDGPMRNQLSQLAVDLGVEDRLTFHGSVTDVETLHGLYRSAVCAVSPGYAGLSVTQSLGFGVPILVARDEPHAPEIELRHLGGVTFFDSDSSESLAEALETVMDRQELQDREDLAARVRVAYSAERMADGVVRALQNVPQELDEDGWPA